ncbi:Arylesterase [Dyadobacter sp. CECT 9275]|uniref:Arylesterase n=1 Tax=Dyadobacter helix TaxID=2822344 RepID=A0A916JKJ6_9BACT|nr:GDSL-type esterase/lipase family protein [Dyadobacter sp. CECT 9275]CAG5018595.1 Arylesterase [Dyadobacter sp. CECT 9275]
MSFKKWFILVLLTAGFVDTVLAGNYRSENDYFQPQDSSGVKIVVFGNSVTATRITIKQVFAQRLPGLLAEKGIKAQIINSGIPGSHSGHLADHGLFKIRHALDRFDTDVLGHHPDIVNISFGINDAHIDSKVKNGPSRIPLDKYRANLTYMIETLQSRGISVILMVPNILGEKYGDIQNDRLLQYCRVVRKLAKKYHTGLVDNFKSFKNYQKTTGISYETLMLDGVHPNDRGHEIIAANLAEQIENIVYQKLRN